MSVKGNWKETDEADREREREMGKRDRGREGNV